MPLEQLLAGENTNVFESGLVDAVYVIHAQRFADRAAHMVKQLARFRIPFEWIAEHDAETIAPELKERFMAPDYPFTLNKFSCAMKHFEALRRIATRGHKRALVLEDDVLMDGDFNAQLGRMVAEAGSIRGPHTIQIGSGGNMFTPRWRLRPGQCLYETDQVRTNEAYLIGAETAQLRVDWLDRNRISKATDHTFNDIDREVGIRCFWGEPAIVTQGSMNGTFRSSLDDGRDTQPLWYLKARFAWQRLRRRYVYPMFG